MVSLILFRILLWWAYNCSYFGHLFNSIWDNWECSALFLVELFRLYATFSYSNNAWAAVPIIRKFAFPVSTISFHFPWKYTFPPPHTKQLCMHACYVFYRLLHRLFLISRGVIFVLFLIFFRRVLVVCMTGGRKFRSRQNFLLSFFPIQWPFTCHRFRWCIPNNRLCLLYCLYVCLNRIYYWSLCTTTGWSSACILEAPIGSGCWNS